MAITMFYTFSEKYNKTTTDVSFYVCFIDNVDPYCEENRYMPK